jgi:hypothetical protein
MPLSRPTRGCPGQILGTSGHCLLALPGFEWVTEGAEIGVRGRMMACGRGDEIGDNLAGCLMTRSPITTPG